MKEVRVSNIAAEERANAGGNALILKGRPIVFEQPTVIHDPAGSFTEVIKRGALDDADLSDVRLCYGHNIDSRVPLARTPKTMTLSAGPAGLDMEAALPETEGAKEVYTAVKRGDLSGMSFAFKVPKGGDSYDHKTKTRTITKIEKVLECSVVPFPAYPQASVEARAAFTDSDKHEQAIIACNMIQYKGEL